MNTKSIYFYLLVVSILLLGACGDTTDNQESKTTTVTTGSQASSDNEGLPTKDKPGTTEISPQDAVKIAEAFVASQGYTSKTVDLSKQKITFEQGEFASDTANLLANRQNTLQVKAMGARQYGKNFSWAVGFRQIPYEENIVRTVMMDSLGNNVKIAPQTVREDWIMGNNSDLQKKEEN